MTATSGAPSRSSASVIILPDPWLDAEGTEKIPGDLLPIECVYRRRRSSAPYAERSISGLQGCEVDEFWSMLAEVFEGFPGEEGKIAVIPLVCIHPSCSSGFCPQSAIAHPALPLVAT